MLYVGSQQNQSLAKINRASTIKTLRNAFLSNPLSSLLLDRTIWAWADVRTWEPSHRPAHICRTHCGAPASCTECWGKNPTCPFTSQLIVKCCTDPILLTEYIMLLEDFTLWAWNILEIVLLFDSVVVVINLKSQHCFVHIQVHRL